MKKGQKKRTLKDSVTPLPYYATFDYPLEDEEKEKSVVSSGEDSFLEGPNSSTVEDKEGEEVEVYEPKKMGSRWSNIGDFPAHMRRGTLIYQPKPLKKHKSSKSIGIKPVKEDDILKNMLGGRLLSRKSMINPNTEEEDQYHADSTQRFITMKQKFTPDFILSKIDYAKLSNICQ